ncbi:MAG TPA: alpha/beta fold hydrolase [Chloroflexota bacterium]|nr:alpha/beta fold hydrolase [Chloroflexota bacterium]
MVRWQRRLLASTLGVLGAVMVGLAAGTPPGDAAPGRQAAPVVTELVKVPTEDGVVLDGALYTPDTPERRTTAALIIHGIYGNFYGAVPTFLGRGLAAAGYPTLALNLRSHDHHYIHSVFPDTAKDIRAGIDYLIEQGARQVYLAGHSLGTVSTPYYVATADDPRVAALGLYAPLDDLPSIQRHYQLGPEEYDRWVAQARELVARGEGDTVLLAPMGIRGDLRRLSAATFLSWRGPEAETVPVRWLPQVRVPLLVVYGEDDWVRGPAGQRHFREHAQAVYAAATAAPQRAVRETPGDHFFTGHEEAVVRLTVDWLAELGLDASQPAARPAPGPYTTELVFFASDDGTPLQGALYLPRGAAQPVAVIVLHGTEGNFYSSVPGFLAPGLAARGYPTLALNRRDHDDGFARSDFEGGLRDVRAAVDFLAARGYPRVVLAGHSLGSTFASAYVPQTGDARVVALVLLGALADLPARTQEFVPPEEYARTWAWAAEQVAAGRDWELTFIPFYTGGQLLTSARAFLSYRVPGSLAVPREQIRGVALPLLLVHDSNDTVARLEFSQEIAANALAAPRVDLVELVDPVPRSPNAGHAHVGLEAETITAVADWLDAHVGAAAATTGHE